MKSFKLTRSVLLVVATLSGGALSAQEASREVQWGTVAIGGTGGGDVHGSNSLLAARVNAAQNGLLLDAGGGSVSITAIGAQNIVQSIINGDNNSVTQDVESQEANNSGDITNNGTLVFDAIPQDGVIDDDGTGDVLVTTSPANTDIVTDSSGTGSTTTPAQP